MLTAITCTGGRPDLFALCRRWMLRQTVQPDRWVVTTDAGDAPFAPEAEVFSIPESYEHPPCRSQSSALRALSFAMSLVDNNTDVVVFEDDDWYGPRYIESVFTDAWASHQSIMEMFHLPGSRYATGPYPDPVEGMLAFRAGNIDRVRKWLLTHPRPPLGSTPIADMHQLAQIKGVGFGVPGRRGATRKHISGHRKMRGMAHDPDHARFRQVVGADADAYLQLLR